MKTTVASLPCGCNPVVYRSILTDLPKHSQTVRVFDPETKAGYLLIFEGATAVANGAHSSVAPTAGLRTCFEGKGGRRRFFLCKQFQAGRCRAHENCNSIHACREAIQQIRAASGDAGSDEDSAQAAAAREQPLALACQDGAALEAFELQVSKTEYTIARDIAVGRQAAAEGDAGGAEAAASVVPPEELPQVCLDHEAGHCAAGSLCSRIHVSVKYMKHIRQLWRTPCCSSASCGAAEAVSARLNPPPRGFRIVTSEAGGDGSDEVHPVARLGFTVGLSTLCKGQLGGRSHAGAAGGVLRVFAGKLCRPHARKMCKWGTKCNNLHVCRELLKPALHALRQEDAARAQAAPGSTADTAESSSSAPRTSPSVSIVGDAPHTPVARCRVPAQVPQDAAAVAAASLLPPTPPAQQQQQQQRQQQLQQLLLQEQQQEQQKFLLQQQLQQLQQQQQQQQIGALSGVAGVPNMQQNVVWTVVNPLQQLVHQQQAVQAHLLGSLQMTQMRLQQMQVLQQLLEQNPQQTATGFPQLQA